MATGEHWEVNGTNKSRALPLSSLRSLTQRSCTNHTLLLMAPKERLMHPPPQGSSTTYPSGFKVTQYTIVNKVAWC